MSARRLERWIYQEVHGKLPPRKPPKMASVLREKPYRSYRYRAWIKSLPSAVSGLTPCDPCHTGPHAFGRKASDLTCIPLTREEHEAHTRDPRGFEAKHELDVKALVKRLNRSWFKSLQEGL